MIQNIGNGKSTKYEISPYYEVFYPIDSQNYFLKEIDERIVKERFNQDLIPNVFAKVSIFSDSELKTLNSFQEKYILKIKELSQNEYNKELERLAIDLSWKSSQIEGNTYSLLETERLLKDKLTSSGRTKDEAIMLLNHKEALDFIIQNPSYIHPLSISNIESIHSLLVKDLEIDRNIRKRMVAITGTNYKPLDNEFQIIEAIRNMCEVINAKENIFEKTFLVLILICYIQAFGDGKKRTARIICNAILINHNFCQISFRTVDSVEYKKAMLIFYEQNNVTVFKKIFIQQFEFAVNTYF